MRIVIKDLNEVFDLMECIERANHNKTVTDTIAEITEILYECAEYEEEE